MLRDMLSDETEKCDESHSDRENEERPTAAGDIESMLSYDWPHLLSSSGLMRGPPAPLTPSRLLHSIARAPPPPSRLLHTVARAPPPPSNRLDAALGALPPPEDLSYHFSEADLEREIERKFLSFIANSCDDETNYRRLARKVNLDSRLMRRLQDDYSNHTREYVYQVLLAWRKRHPQAKVRDLVALLSEGKLPEAAVLLKKYLASIDWRD